MTVALFDTAQVGAIADAIRAKDGDATPMTVAQMPARIAAIEGGTETWRECWLEKPLGAPASLGIDTNIPADFGDELRVECRTTIGAMSAPFIAAASSGNRYGINFLPSGNRIQVFWGSFNNTNITLDRSEYDLTNRVNYTMNAAGVSIDCYTAGGADASYSLEFSATHGSGTEPTYKLFSYPRNADINKGVFGRAVISKDAGSVHYVVIPEVSSKFNARLCIYRALPGDDGKIFSTIPLPAGFICHVTNKAAA